MRETTTVLTCDICGEVVHNEKSFIQVSVQMEGCNFVAVNEQFDKEVCEKCSYKVTDLFEATQPQEG